MSKRTENKPGRAWNSGDSWAKHVRTSRLARHVAKLRARMMQPGPGAHLCRTYDPTCYRCDLGRDEVNRGR